MINQAAISRRCLTKENSATLLFCARHLFLTFTFANDKRVVVSVAGPWSVWHLVEIDKLPISHVGILKIEIIAHRRRNIESRASVQVRFGSLVTKNVFPMIGAKWTGIFPLGVNYPTTFTNRNPAIFAN